MPQNRPEVLSTYLGKIIRRAAIDTYRKRHSAKREGSQYALSLEELKESAGMEPTGGEGPEEAAEAAELAACISAFLRERPEEKRQLFLSRYFFMDSLEEIAARTGRGEGTLRSDLFRERKALREYLRREGYAV